MCIVLATLKSRTIIAKVPLFGFGRLLHSNFLLAYFILSVDLTFLYFLLLPFFGSSFPILAVVLLPPDVSPELVVTGRSDPCL